MDAADISQLVMNGNVTDLRRLLDDEGNAIVKVQLQILILDEIYRQARLIIQSSFFPVDCLAPSADQTSFFVYAARYATNADLMRACILKVIKSDKSNGDIHIVTAFNDAILAATTESNVVTLEALCDAANTECVVIRKEVATEAARVAITRNNMGIIHFLIGANEPFSIDVALEAALRSNQHAIFQEILNMHPESVIDSYGRHIISRFAWEGQSELVKASVPVCLPRSLPHTRQLNKLSARNKPECLNPFIWAALGGHETLAKSLAMYHFAREFPLMELLVNSKKTVTTALGEVRARVARDPNWAFGVLREAAQKESMTLVHVLRAMGVPSNNTREQGIMLYALAKFTGFKQLAQECVERLKVDPPYKGVDDDGWKRSYLWDAVRNGRLRRLRLLSGLYGNYMIHGNCTLLMLAVYYNHLNVVHELIRAGADVNVRIGDQTALSFARTREHTAVIEVLRRHGARTDKEARVLNTAYDPPKKDCVIL